MFEHAPQRACSVRRHRRPCCSCQRHHRSQHHCLQSSRICAHRMLREQRASRVCIEFESVVAERGHYQRDVGSGFGVVERGQVDSLGHQPVVTGANCSQIRFDLRGITRVYSQLRFLFGNALWTGETGLRIDAVRAARSGRCRVSRETDHPPPSPCPERTPRSSTHRARPPTERSGRGRGTSKVWENARRPVGGWGCQDSRAVQARIRSRRPCFGRRPVRRGPERDNAPARRRPGLLRLWPQSPRNRRRNRRRTECRTPE